MDVDQLAVVTAAVLKKAKLTQAHYCGPLSGRPEMFVPPHGKFYTLYNAWFSICTDAFYEKFNTDNDPLYDLVEEEERAAA